MLKYSKNNVIIRVNIIKGVVYMNIAYSQVSSNQQNDDRQFTELKNYNIEKWFNEKSNASEIRPQLNAMLDFIRCGDTIYVWDFTNLARSINELLTIGEQLESKGINLICINENLDTSTDSGKLMFTMIKSIKEFQRGYFIRTSKGWHRHRKGKR